MSRFYLSLDSSYRNRNEYPYPSDFVAMISQSGSKGARAALDPVCSSQPASIAFVPFAAVNGTVLASGTPPGSSGFVMRVVTGAASRVQNYYAGIVMVLNDTVNNYYARIYTWKYLYTSGGNDNFAVVFTDSFFSINTANPITFTINDPSIVADPNNIIIFVPASLSIQNLYTEYYIYNQTLNQWLSVTRYDQDSHVVIATPVAGDNYTPGTWLIGNTYVIRQSIPSQYGLVTGGGSTPSLIQLAAAASIGSFVRIISGINSQSRRIVAFNSLTNVATVDPAFTIATAAAPYEILSFTRDNVGNIIYNFSEVTTSMAVCYKVLLLNMSLPNSALLNSYGGRAIYYPYLFVALESVNSSEGKGPNMIASNNPNAVRMLFRVSINDSTNEATSPIIRLSGSGMVQHIKVRPTDSFRFSVYLPDGSLFVTETQDDFSPAAPNPLIQISALFYFERIL